MVLHSFCAWPSTSSMRILSGPSMNAYLILPPAALLISSVTFTPSLRIFSRAAARLSKVKPTGSTTLPFVNLAAALEKIRKAGVKVTDEIKSAAGGKIKYAFIEGPDKIRIELVEGQAQKE